MLAIGLIFLMVVIPIAILVWAYNKYLSRYVSDSMARKLEIIGYVLLFISIVWQMIVKDILMDSFYNAKWLYLDNNLFQIHTMLKEHVNGWQPITENYRYQMQTSQNDRVQLQMKFVDISEALLTLFSTALIAIGRFQDLKKIRD